VLERENPRVALMNIGEEPSKGSALTQEAYALLFESALNFVGNVEGKGMFQGGVDVVVCDGFVGNTVLKLVEGMKDMLQAMLGGTDGSGSLAPLLSQFDYSEYGGAPLLGVNGVVIIAHGSSSPKAIKNAVSVAARFADNDLGARIADRVREVEGNHGG
jgi:glycerol-3-phosphate acyltransferase PlsX